MEEEEISVDEASEIEATDKCLVPSVANVEKNAKYLLNQLEQNLFIAVSVLKKEVAEWIQEDPEAETEAIDDLKIMLNLTP